MREENRVLREQLGARRLWHLRVLVAEYVEHYNFERNHQGIGNRLIQPALDGPANDVGGAVRRRKRLGGLLSFYHWDVLERVFGQDGARACRRRASSGALSAVASYACSIRAWASAPG